MKNKTSSLGRFNDNSHEFIPICCHYDSETLLTKNGELIQTIQINGINQENISSNLLSLREIIRGSLKNHVNTTDLACWIHTIRKKRNLDDTSPYPNMFSQNIHNIWVKKNYWNDKFINTLFISFVYKGVDLKITNFSSFFQSFNKTKIAKEYFIHLNNAKEKLNQVVSAITNDLLEFGVQTLGITLEGQDAYCEITSLFQGILRFTETPTKIDQSDLSKIIGSFDYAIGSNKIEVISENDRKYASILSIKEYQDLSSKSLDKLLQQPTEFVITEVFHFVHPEEAKQHLKYQEYILSVSGDVELERQKGLSQMREIENKYKAPFCYQQISILIMNEDEKMLTKSISDASFQLSKVGLVHILEDVNIENTFWAQIPGNFKYLRRLKPNSVENVASMASLHNFPAGNHTNPWGKAITILRSERGTPYFFNFHDKAGNGSGLIIGNSRSGKTIIANFLISEALKYASATLFITYANDSQVFIKANQGKWANNPYKLDPFKISSINNNDIFVKEFLRAISGDNYSPLTAEEQICLQKLTSYILEIEPGKRSFIKISEFIFEGEGAESFKAKISPYLPGGEYHEYFVDDGLWNNENIKEVQGISFESYTNAAFAKQYYPKEEKLLPEYEKKLEKFSTFREFLLYCNVLKYVDTYSNAKQIVKIENFNTLCTSSLKIEFYHSYFKKMTENNNIYLNSIQFSPETPFFSSELWKEMQAFFSTKLLLAAESITPIWKEKLYLPENEYQKLKSTVVASRLFLVKQDNLTITCELSLGGLQGVIKMMSADKNIIEACNKIIEAKGEDTANWLIEFYDSIR